MIKKALILENLAEGQVSCSVHSPSPGTLEGDELLINERGSEGEGWQNSIKDLTGHGRLFSFRANVVKETTVFTSRASEPVLALRLQMLNESYTRYSDKDSEYVLWPMQTCYLFWMDNNPVEDRLLPGNHAYCDLLFRVDSLGAVGENEKVKSLIAGILAKGSEFKEPVTVNLSLALYQLIIETMLPEITSKSITLERFSYLCDCVLLLCCGEEVDVKSISEMPAAYKTNIEEEQFLQDELVFFATLKSLSKEQLVRKFTNLRKRVSKLKNSWNEVSRTRQTLRELCAEENNTQRILFGDVSLQYAHFFDTMYQKTDEFTIEERDLIKKLRIVCSNNNTFLKAPLNNINGELYVDWDAIFDSPEETLSSESLNEPSCSKTESHYNTEIEYNRANLGYMPMSLFRENEKPKEVVAIYQRLMDHLSDTLTLNEGEGVESNGDIGVVESAFENNDYIVLLRLDALYFGEDNGYVSSLDETYLRHLLVALEGERRELAGQVRKATTQNYAFQLYHTMEGDLTKVKDRMLLDIVDLNAKMIALLTSMKIMYTKVNSKEVMEIAQKVKDLDKLFVFRFF